MQAMGKVMGLKLIGTFKIYGDHDLGKVKTTGLRKMAVEQSKIKGETLHININLPSTVSLGDKKLFLLVNDASINNAWSSFLKEKSG